MPPRRRGRARRPVAKLVVAIAAELRREGIELGRRPFFSALRKAGYAFDDKAARVWVRAGRPRKLAPRSPRERARRIVVAAFRAIEDAEGRGCVRRARELARAFGARFGDHDASLWLERFGDMRFPGDEPRLNLRRPRPVETAVA